MRILLIDDDMTVVENLTLFLRNDFHAVESLTYAKDREALRLKLEQFSPDGVILDYGMEILGTEIFVWIREWKNAVSIVFYTNYARSQEKELMLKAGAKESHIIEKREVGLDIEAILDALRNRG
jgi:DNA-binding response OmpR family regulator